jgi:tight adherence protein C
MLETLKYIFQAYSFDREYAVIVFTAVAFFLFFVISFLIVRNLVRIREVKMRAYAPTVAGHNQSGFDRRLPRNEGAQAVSTALAKAAARFAPDKMSRSSSAIREDLIQAGFHDPSALAWYYFARVLCSLALPAIVFPILIATSLADSVLKIVLPLIILALIGLVLPSLYLMRRKSKLAEEYRDGFPEFMDLLVVCVEAGIGISAAISRVTEEITKSHNNLGINLHIMALELRAGRNLTEAFEGLGHRVAIDEVRSLGSLLQQSEQLGTSLAEALRTYSKEMREKRYFRAEEKAYALPAKMVVPLGLFVFPVMMIVIMLPLAIRIYEGLLTR